MFHKLSKKSAVLAALGCLTAAGLFSVSAAEIPGEPLPQAPESQSAQEAPVPALNVHSPYKISDSTLNYFLTKGVITKDQASAMEQCMDAIYWENKAQMKKYKADRMVMEEDLIHKAKLTAAQAHALFPVGKKEGSPHNSSFYGHRFSIPDYVQSFVANKMITAEQAEILIKELAMYQQKGREERGAYSIHLRQQTMDAAKKAGIGEDILVKMQDYTQLYDQGMGSQILESKPLPTLTMEQQNLLKSLQIDLREKNTEQMTLYEASRLRIIAEATEKAKLTSDQARALFPGKISSLENVQKDDSYFDPDFKAAGHLQKMVFRKVLTKEQADILQPALVAYQDQCLQERNAYNTYVMDKIEAAARETGLTPGQVIHYLQKQANADMK